MSYHWGAPHPIHGSQRGSRLYPSIQNATAEDERVRSVAAKQGEAGAAQGANGSLGGNSPTDGYRQAY